ncbi:MAG: redoxin domain-containing protein [Bacteroidales bacterium]|nr:redoxin domain-containing protein [Bacteroidales bacterium]MBN2699645.1 redoxin domain-containing protein [Bacteroidales bacterium]
MKNKFLFIAVFAISVLHLKAQEITIPQIGSRAPSFSAISTQGLIVFPEDFGSKWKILFSHPKDFTPVCSSELLELAYEQEFFYDSDVELVVMSVDLISQHYSWKYALEEVRYKDREPVQINFPIISDNDHKISKLYGMIHTEEDFSQNIRGVFIIDPDNYIRSIQYYPNEVGRNIEEIKRMLMALKETHANKNLVTPANWHKGDDVIVPVLSREEKEKLDTPESELYKLTWFMVFRRQ